MSTSKPNIKIINSKVVFSNDVMKYINSWRTEENSEYIDEYIKILSEPSNFIATKFEIHHIIPVFIFKNKTHINRRETEKLANKITENKIKLSLKNHKLAHYYLWKIFPNNENARRAVYLMFNKNNIKDLTEDEIIEFAKILEECADENLTEDEKRNQRIEYYNNKKNNPIFRQLKREYDKIRMSTDEYKSSKQEYDKNYYKINKEKRCNYCKIYGQNHKKEKQKYDKNLHKQVCFDPIAKEYCTYKQLSHRKHDYVELKDLYKDVNLKSCIITDKNIINQFYKEKEEKEKLEKLLNSLPKICLDPIKNDYCYMQTLRIRISKNPNLYKNVKTTECKLTDINKIIELDKLFKSKTPKDNIKNYYDPIKQEYCTKTVLYGRKYHNKSLYKDIIVSKCKI